LTKSKLIKSRVGKGEFHPQAFETTMGVQLYSHKEGNGKSELRCRVNANRIQSQENCQYFDHRSAERVSKDACFDVFKPFWDHFQSI
jgi:hypothetical protein